MNRFEQKREEARRRYERELADLERKEAEEREKRITPTVAKLVAAMERTARKFLEDNVEMIDGFSFRRGRVEERMVAMLGEMFAASAEQGGEEKGDGNGDAKGDEATDAALGAAVAMMTEPKDVATDPVAADDK